MRVDTQSFPADIITYRKTNAHEFRAAIYNPPDTTIEVIEVTRRDIHECGLGQVIAASDLLEGEYHNLLQSKPERIRKVIICTDIDSAIKRVCEKREIQIWLEGSNNRTRRRRLSKLSENQSALLKAYWNRFGGVVFTEVGLYDRLIDAIRVVSPNLKDEIISYRESNAKELITSIHDSRIEAMEVIKVMPGHFGRCAFGQLLADSDLLELKYQDLAQFKPSAISKTLIRTITDAPMESICEKHKFRVWPLPTDDLIMDKRR